MFTTNTYYSVTVQSSSLYNIFFINRIFAVFARIDCQTIFVLPWEPIVEEKIVSQFTLISILNEVRIYILYWTQQRHGKHLHIYYTLQIQFYVMHFLTNEPSHWKRRKLSIVCGRLKLIHVFPITIINRKTWTYFMCSILYIKYWTNEYYIHYIFLTRVANSNNEWNTHKTNRFKIEMYT